MNPKVSPIPHLILTLLLAALLLALASCGDKSTADPTNPNNTGAGDDNSLAAQLTWVKANAQTGGSYNLTAWKDETLAPNNLLSYNGKTNITINLKGDSVMRTISLSSIGGMFTVDSGVTLILDGNITLEGYSYSSYVSPVINVVGTLTMNEGTVITGGSSGVTVSGTFTMNGGTITANHPGSSGLGGGVFVGVNLSNKNGGIFTMYGGTISNNTAGQTAYSGYGGGVYIDTGTFTMNGGTVSTNGAGNGSGVAAGTDGTFTMNDGSIIYNTGTFGGGVYIDRNNGTFDMKGGTISNNTAGYYGGGVYMDGVSGNYGTFTKTGGTITGYGDDKTNGNRAGSGSTAYVSSSQLRENTAGSGVNMDSRITGSSGGWE